ncbi:serine/threonine protein kinase [Rubinisphaera italica]|uniref:non-specific serine/threonine protein kinase n=1 Tax=Rubinisphaera italica TaxID=2527969 RepID=A0A5C5XGC4_9PLAN|nr:serine/threonine-protein kinase [Rubinisphaera italica]TWT62107.1 Serine/threonine-protein kinase PrkC [Rubinisphaera italica]
MSVKTADRIGMTIAGGRYEILSHIGTGSMGHVYRAFDNRLETYVCIKVPTTARLSDPDFVRRFEQESRFLVKLAHPQVVNIIDVGVEDDTPYIVMQFIGGGTLLDRMQDANGNLNPRPIKDLKHWLPSVAKALDFMHEQECIHRDVKPANILFDDHNNAFLGDFGLSKLLMEEDSPEDNRLTAKGAVVGTPNYVAPEIVLGKTYDGRADQYSLAITVYEFLTAQTPLEGPTASATMVNQTTKQPPPLTKFSPNIPLPLNAAVLKALSKSCLKRYSNCEEFADAVMSSVFTGLSSHSIPTRPSDQSSVTGQGSTVVNRPPKFIATQTAKAVSPGKIPCPKCDKKLVVGSQHAGMIATCSGCGSRLQIANDVESLTLLKLNPNYNSKIHAASSHESEHVSTVLKTEVFGKALSERQAVYLIGGTLLSILVGAVWFGLQLSNETVKQQTKRQTRTISREGHSERIEVAKVPVGLAYSFVPEEQAWIDQQIQDFSKLNSVNAKVNLAFNAQSDQTSFQLMKKILESGSNNHPALLSTRSSFENQQLKQLWSEKYPESQMFSREETLYSSPLVCLMWQSRYFEFQKKYGEVNLKNILQAAVSDADWNTIAGKPQWGLFRFSMPSFNDPYWGDLMLLTASHQSLNTSEPLTALQISDANLRDDLRRLDKLAINPRSSEDAMLEIVNQAVQSGPDYADVLIMTEQAALKALPDLEKKWNQFVQVVYLDPAPQWQRTAGIISQIPADQADGAATFLNHLLNSESMTKLANEGFRPASGSLSPFDSPIFSRYRLRGVQETPPNRVAIPDAEVMQTLRETFERVQLQ